ncbi:MAG: hypothetical protein QNJ16_14705 [Rhodobacter sp.]|nr:hypothetical protein [Rhodobacter sp.]
MFSSFQLLLRLPFWAYLILAVGALFLGEELRKQAEAYEAEKKIARAQGAPAPVDLTEFQPDEHVGAADEVHVTGWVDVDYNYHLVKRRKGLDTERYALMLFGAGDADGSREVRAAIVLTETDRDTFVDGLPPKIVDYTETGPILKLNGQMKTSVTLDDMFYDALREQGLKRADNFIFIEPYLEGREAALASDPNAAHKVLQTSRSIAALLAMLGFLRFFTGGPQRPQTVRREKRDAMAEMHRAASAALAQRGEPAPGYTSDANAAAFQAPANSPIAEFYKKYERPVAPVAEPAIAPEPELKPAAKKRPSRKWLLLALAAVAIGGFGVLSLDVIGTALPLIILAGFWFLVWRTLRLVKSVTASAANFASGKRSLFSAAQGPASATKSDGDPFDRLAAEARRA